MRSYMSANTGGGGGAWGSSRWGRWLRRGWICLGYHGSVKISGGVERRWGRGTLSERPKDAEGEELVPGGQRRGEKLWVKKKMCAYTEDRNFKA
eukprot:768765-Hanusia_phi.AAC.2